MTEKFIDHVNEILESRNISKSTLSRITGIDKNSLGKYLRKQRAIPLHAALKIADYLNLDISKICDIKTENLLSEVETELIREIRDVPEFAKVQTTLALINTVKVINSLK